MLVDKEVVRSNSSLFHRKGYICIVVLAGRDLSLFRLGILRSHHVAYFEVLVVYGTAWVMYSEIRNRKHCWYAIPGVVPCVGTTFPKENLVRAAFILTTMEHECNFV